MCQLTQESRQARTWVCLHSVSHIAELTPPPQAPGRFWNTTQRVGWVRAGEMPGCDTGMGTPEPRSLPSATASLLAPMACCLDPR